MSSVHVALLMNYGLSYCREILYGIRRYALSKPNWVFLTTRSEPAMIKRLLRSSLDGVIAQVHNPATNAAFAGWKRPLVNISRVVPGLIWPRVGVDESLVGALAARHLQEQGLRHFAFVGHLGYEYGTKREAAFRQALGVAHHSSLALERRRLDLGDSSTSRSSALGEGDCHRFSASSCTYDCYETTPEMPMVTKGRPWALDRRILRWLRGLPKPVGIFAANDTCAANLSEVCREGGLHVPKEVALIGVDNDDLFCELARPLLSSVAIPGERIGYEAAALLDRLMSGAPPPREPVVLPPIGIVARESSDLAAVDDPHVAAALRFIRSHQSEPLRVADVLRAVPISRRRLEQRFLQLLQRTPGEEIRRVHLENAKRLLSGTHQTLSAIAQQSGFSDSKHLCYVFRQELGCTPTEYRRGNQGGEG